MRNVRMTIWLMVVCLCLINSPAVLAECPSADLSGDCFVGLADLAIMASQWMTEGTFPPPSITWVYINDPGVSGHEGFTGEMSKYETTNAQYCQFLNAALASGDVVVVGRYVNGSDGSNSGADFVGQPYYNRWGSGYTFDGATNGGAARINYSGGVFSVDSGFENHPVTYVSWYGATAFCNYYGWRLPTEWEWQAVADHEGEFIYGCGVTINNSIANYNGSTHPDGTTVVGSLGNPAGYGYGMCDMAGNVWEHTSSVNSTYPKGDRVPEGDRVACGGCWYNYDFHFTVSERTNYFLDSTTMSIGFRVCR